MHVIFSFIIFINCFLSVSGQDKSRFVADSYSRKASENKIILNGNVNIINGKNYLSADYVELNTKDDSFTASGNVTFKGDGFELKGKKLVGNMNSPTGVLSSGKVVSGRDIIEGEKIQRTSKNSFSFQKGRYTSCLNDPPDWRLYGKNINMTIGEYAYLDNVVVEAFGIPALYIPFLAVPLKTERQTGLLTPSFGFGSDGFNIHESLFVVLSRSHDMTLTLGHYSKRGLKEGFEFRSAFAEDTNSTFYYFHVKDEKFKSTLIRGEPIGKSHRHGLKIDQIFRLSEETYAKTQIRLISDDDLPRDFPEEIEGKADPALESKLVLMSRSDNVAYTADIAYYEDLLSFDPTHSNKDQLHRVPELRLNFAKTKASIFLFEGDVSYLNIYRSGLAFDDFNNNNVFDENEFIRTGQRFDIYPRASIPITTKYLKITPLAGLRYDFYKLPIAGNAHRSYGEIRTSIVSEFSRVYKRDETKNYRSIKHTIEPFLDHRVIPSVYQSQHPFFDNKREEIKSPMFDSIDAISKTHSITYGITNRLIAKYVSNLFTPKSVEVCSECISKQKEEKDLLLTGSSSDFLQTRESKDKNIEQENQIEQKEDNNFAGITKNNKDDDFKVLQPFLWKIYQSYNFLDTQGTPFGYLYSDIWANYSLFSLGLQKFYNIYTKKMGLTTHISASDGNKYINLAYSYDKTTENARTDQIRMGLGFSFWRFSTNSRIILNNEFKGTLLDKIQDKYIDLSYNPPSSCWTLTIAARDPYDKEGFDITFSFNLLISGEKVGFGKDNSFWNK